MSNSSIEAGHTGRLLTRRFVMATVANFVFFIGVTIFFSLPVHLHQLGANRAEIGRIMGSFGFAALITIPLTGVLVDRFGRKPFMVAGALGWAALAVGFALMGGLGWAPYLLRMGQGAAFSLAFVATNALIVDVAPRGALGRAIAVFGTTTLLSHAIGPSVGEWIATRVGFSQLFFLAAGAALLAAGLFALLHEPVSRRAWRDVPAVGMLELAFRRGARGALVGGLSSAVAFGSAIHFMPVFVRARGLAGHAPFFTSYVVAAILVRLVGGGLGDRIGHRRVGALGALVFGCAVIAFSWVGQPWHLVGVGLLFGMAHGWAYPSMNALFVETAPEAARGRAMALFNLSFNVGMTIAAFAAGELAERLGYSAMWTVMGGVAVIGVVAVWADRTQEAKSAG